MRAAGGGAVGGGEGQRRVLFCGDVRKKGAARKAWKSRWLVLSAPGVTLPPQVLEAAAAAHALAEEVVLKQMDSSLKFLTHSMFLSRCTITKHRK